MKQPDTLTIKNRIKLARILGTMVVVFVMLICLMVLIIEYPYWYLMPVYLLSAGILLSFAFGLFRIIGGPYSGSIQITFNSIKREAIIEIKPKLVILDEIQHIDLGKTSYVKHIAVNWIPPSPFNYRIDAIQQFDDKNKKIGTILDLNEPEIGISIEDADRIVTFLNTHLLHR